MFLVTTGLACRMCFVKERIYTIKEQAATILHCQAPRFTIRVVSVQQQEGWDSCGLFAIVIAYDLCNRQDPFVSTYNESRLRSHLQRCCQQERISPFPRGNPSRRRKRILNETSVDVFCTCQYPDIDLRCILETWCAALYVMSGSMRNVKKSQIMSSLRLLTGPVQVVISSHVFVVVFIIVS